MEPANTREYGRAHLAKFDHDNPLLKDVRENSQVWMSHGDTITSLPENFRIIASTDKVAVAAYQAEGEKLWGVQFHPEVFHTEDGTQILKKLRGRHLRRKAGLERGFVHRNHRGTPERTIG